MRALVVCLLSAGAVCATALFAAFNNWLFLMLAVFLLLAMLLLPVVTLPDERPAPEPEQPDWSGELPYKLEPRAGSRRVKDG